MDHLYQTTTVVITVGTPVDDFLNPDMSQIKGLFRLFDALI